MEKSGRVEGSRIINLEKLQEYINTFIVHAAQCGGDILLTGEKEDGFASINSIRCSQCKHSILLEAQKVKGPSGYCRWECNLTTVWGQRSTGGGHFYLQETMRILVRRPWGFLVLQSCLQRSSLTQNEILVGMHGE